jgi:hypothetical protein
MTDSLKCVSTPKRIPPLSIFALDTPELITDGRKYARSAIGTIVEQPGGGVEWRTRA